MKTMKKNVRIICCDNARKKRLSEEFAQKTEEINFEFVSPGNPYQNGVIERGFATVYPQLSAMIYHAGLHEKIKTGICP